METKDRRKKYDKENTVQVSVKLNKKTDADILAWLNRQPNKQGAIKDILRQIGDTKCSDTKRG